MSSETYEQETGFKKIPGDIWHELCITCGAVVDVGWVVRHRRTHEAEKRLITDLNKQAITADTDLKGNR